MQDANPHPLAVDRAENWDSLTLSPWPLTVITAGSGFSLSSLFWRWCQSGPADTQTVRLVSYLNPITLATDATKRAPETKAEATKH